MMIQLSDFSVGYGSRTLIGHASASLCAGSLTALIGRNGSGKSTLLRILAGIGTSYSGTVALQGTDICRLSAPELARTVAYVSTSKPRVAHLSCFDAVAIGRAPYTGWFGNLSAADERIVHDAINAVGMSRYTSVPISDMSDGECQRVMIARALAQQTPVMLLDEPTSFLDLPARYELGQLLRSLAEQHSKCILFSTHELDIARSLCHNIMLIDTPHLSVMPVARMMESGHIQRLFHIPTI